MEESKKIVYLVHSYTLEEYESGYQLLFISLNQEVAEMKVKELEFQQEKRKEQYKLLVAKYGGNEEKQPDFEAMTEYEYDIWSGVEYKTDLWSYSIKEIELI